MCLPVVIAGVAIASAVASIYAQQQQSKMTNATYKQNADNARTAQLNAYEQAGVANSQQYQQATQAATDNALSAARARATATAAAGDSGVAGNSIDSIVNDISRQEGNNYATINTNRDWAVEQARLQGQGIQAQAASQINGAPRAYFNPAIGLLQVGAAGVQGYYSGKQLNAPAASGG